MNEDVLFFVRMAQNHTASYTDVETTFNCKHKNPGGTTLTDNPTRRRCRLNCMLSQKANYRSS